MKRWLRVWVALWILALPLGAEAAGTAPGPQVSSVASAKQPRWLAVLRLMVYVTSITAPLVWWNLRPGTRMMLRRKRSGLRLYRRLRMRPLRRKLFFKNAGAVAQRAYGAVYGEVGVRRNVAISTILTAAVILLAIALTLPQRWSHLQSLVSVEDELERQIAPWLATLPEETLAWARVQVCSGNQGAGPCYWACEKDPCPAIRAEAARAEAQLARAISERPEREDLTLILFWRGPLWEREAPYFHLAMLVVFHVLLDLAGMLAGRWLAGVFRKSGRVARTGSALAISLAVAVALFGAALIVQEHFFRGDRQSFFWFLMLPAGMMLLVAGLAFLFFGATDQDEELSSRLLFGAMGLMLAATGPLLMYVCFERLHWPSWPRFETPSGYNFAPYVLAAGAALPLALCIIALLVAWLTRLLPNALAAPAIVAARALLRERIPVVALAGFSIALIEIVWRAWELVL